MHTFKIFAAALLLVSSSLASPLEPAKVKRDPEPTAPSGGYIQTEVPYSPYLRDYRLFRRQTPPTDEPIEPFYRDGSSDCGSECTPGSG